MGEVNVTTVVNPRPSATIKWNVSPGTYDRAAVASCLGCYVRGAAPNVPDLSDPLNVWAGIMHRIVRAPPAADPLLLEELNGFIRSNYLKYFRRANPDDVYDFSRWIASTSYTEKQKADLVNLHAQMSDPNSPEYKIVKSFIKDESYPSFKNPRTINARSDFLKIIFGPIAKTIEKVTYENSSFVKNIPVPDRPKYCEELLGNIIHLLITDYESFEACFTKAVQQNLEFVHYEECLKEILNYFEFFGLLKDVQTGSQTLIFKFFTVFLSAIRCSGEVTTALGSGVSNFWLTRFICFKSGVDIIGLMVEGDDGETNVTGIPDVEIATRLGFRLKLEVVETVEEASFCGMVYASGSYQIITDPIKQLLNFGWSSRDYVRSGINTRKLLLRAKAFSLLYQFPGCPIIHALAMRTLFLTKGFSVERFVMSRKLDTYKKEMLLAAIKYRGPQVGPTFETRILFEKRYGISVDMQLLTEGIIANWDGGALDLPLEWPEQNVFMYHEYVAHKFVSELDVPVALSRDTSFYSGPSL